MLILGITSEIQDGNKCLLNSQFSSGQKCSKHWACINTGTVLLFPPRLQIKLNRLKIRTQFCLIMKETYCLCEYFPIEIRTWITTTLPLFNKQNPALKLHQGVKPQSGRHTFHARLGFDLLHHELNVAVMRFLTLFFSSFCLCFSSSRVRRFSAFSLCSSSFFRRSSSWLSLRRRALSSFSSHWAFFAAAATEEKGVAGLSEIFSCPFWLG